MRIKAGRGIVIIVAIIGLVGLALPAAWADEGYGHGKGKGSHSGEHGGYGGSHGMGGHHASTGHLIRGLLGSQKEMGLTDEQVAKLKTIQLELDKTRIKAEADIMIAQKEVQAMSEDEKSDLGAIEEKLKQSAAQEVGLRMAALKARRDVMALLTPEQSQRVKTVHEAMMKRYKEERKDGHKDGGMMKGHGAMKGDKKDQEKKP